MENKEPYHKRYYRENRDKIQERQRERYANMSKKDRKEFLDQMKRNRKNETEEQRQDRLSRAKERYQANREDRLAYQKKYALDKKKEFERLKKLVKSIEKDKA